MADFKFSPDLFLEVIELERFQKFLDTDGFRKQIVDNSVSFGLIKYGTNSTATNGRVVRNTDYLTEKILTISTLRAIDRDGLFLVAENLDRIVPSDGYWYWVKVQHAYSSQEVGSISLSINGDLVGVGTEFTKVLRGMPNFPARIKFIDSAHNTLEYDVLEVIDDTHATVVHPACSSTGTATFVVEEALHYSVVGTFTPGVAVPPENKYPFRYDSIKLSLVRESINNTPPASISGKEFYLARVKVVGADLVIQDKRTEWWTTSGMYESRETTQTANPLIGIESIKWTNALSPAYKNRVEIAWGMRSTNWSADTSKNIVTVFGSTLGGRFKTIDDFTDGDFDRWRIYTSNGNYSRIVSSIKQGSAINLTLDVLNIDDYSSDGGLTFNTFESVTIVPDSEEIEIQFISISGAFDNTSANFVFPINQQLGRCEIDVSVAEETFYNVQYRYKTFKTYSPWSALPTDTVGYYSETSFNDQGILNAEQNDRVRYPYIGSLTNNYIRLLAAPFSYSKTIAKVYKGDLLGIKTISNIGATQEVHELIVGTSERYHYFTGGNLLENDVIISLSDVNAIPGNSFRLHFDFTTNILNNRTIKIYRGYPQAPILLKELKYGDICEMRNREGGIFIEFTFSDQGRWDVSYQNYDLGQPFEIKMFDGDVSSYFDASLDGRIRGYYGWKVYSVMAGRVPVGYGSYTDEYGSANYEIGGQGGKQKHTLSVLEMPEHDHNQESGSNATVGWQGDGSRNQFGPITIKTGKTGGSSAHNNMQPYRVLAYIKKLY